MKMASYSATGIGSSNLNMQGTVSSNSTRRTASPKKSNNNKLRKKRVNYNPREIRGALLQATRSQSAGQVLCQARSKLTSLLKCKGTGQYNESELTSAIIHARRMVRCARMKTQNLKQEEQIQKRHEKAAKIEEQQRKNDVKLRVKQKENNLKQKMKNEKLQNLQRQRRRQHELMQRRRLHRLVEKGEMDEADMEYKKNMDRSSSDGSEFRNYTTYFPTEGVEVELSEDGLELTEAQIEQQIEQQIAAMMSAEFSGEAGSTGASAGSGAAGGGSTAAGPDLAGMEMPAIDISIGGV